MKYIAYNPHSGHGKSAELAKSYAEKEGAILVDITEIESYENFFANLTEEDAFVLYGGDGTLNRFVNDMGDATINAAIYYFPAGTGNDFAVDIGKADATEPFRIEKYIHDLPTVTVNGKTTKFINGIGFGIDGYCCEVGDKKRAQGKKANYTAIAITGLLFHFKPVTATVIVDGVERVYKKTWIAPAMFGGHYGGGMLPTPGQSRDGERKLSTCIFHGSGRLKTLMIFPGIFKGEHVKSEKYVEVLSGKEITIKFDRPTALQIDGETVLNVTEYTAKI